MIVYHGTSMARASSLLARGLQPIHGAGPFVTVNDAHAGWYAFCAVCADLRADPAADTTALMLVLSVSDDQLVADPDEPTEYVARGGCPARAVLEWRRLDVSAQLEQIDPTSPAAFAHAIRPTLRRVRPVVGHSPSAVRLRGAERGETAERRRDVLAGLTGRRLAELERQADALQADVIAGRLQWPRYADVLTMGPHRREHMPHPDALGWGTNRYVIALADDVVAKLSWPWAARGFAVQNAIERAWTLNADEHIRDWLAPVVSLTSTGAALQVRVQHPATAPDVEQREALMARGFDDAQRDEGWGLFAGSPVLVDYGSPNRATDHVAGEARRMLADVDGADVGDIDRRFGPWRERAIRAMCRANGHAMRTDYIERARRDDLRSALEQWDAPPHGTADERRAARSGPLSRRERSSREPVERRRRAA